MPDISIHAPRAGSDCIIPRKRARCLLFQSTLPVRGATYLYKSIGVGLDISIHAPRAGSDCSEDKVSRRSGISIHAPRAGSDFW